MTDQFTYLKVHERGRQTIQNAYQHAQAVHTIWSQMADVGVPDAAKWATETLDTWARQVSALFTNTMATEQRVFTDDGQLSLYVTTDTIVFGVIFHPVHRPPEAGKDDFNLGLCTMRMGRYCRIHLGADFRGRPCCLPLDYSTGACPDHGEDVEAFALPVPGRWDFHS